MTVDEGVAHLDERFRSRAFTDGDRAVWLLVRAELRRRKSPSSITRAMVEEMAKVSRADPRVEIADEPTKRERRSSVSGLSAATRDLRDTAAKYGGKP